MSTIPKTAEGILKTILDDPRYWGQMDRQLIFSQFATVVSSGHQEKIHWMVEAFGITAAEIRADGCRVLTRACGNGFLTIAQWLADKFGLSAADVQTGGKCPSLYWACHGGHLAVARWLVERFDLTIAEIQADKETLVANAAIYGRKDVLEWLVDEFGLFIFGETQWPIWEGIGRAVFYTCNNRHLEIAKWLVASTKLDAKNVSDKWLTSIFTIACERGNLDIALWFSSWAGLTAEDMRAKYKEALHGAYKVGCLAAVQWMVDNFALTSDDARECLSITPREPTPGYSATRDWLKARFKLD